MDPETLIGVFTGSNFHGSSSHELREVSFEIFSSRESRKIHFVFNNRSRFAESVDSLKSRERLIDSFEVSFVFLKFFIFSIVVILPFLTDHSEVFGLGMDPL